MTKESSLGEWLDINFVNNEFFPLTPLDVDFRNLEFSNWNGIDYTTGGYTSKSKFIDDILDEEKEIFELDKFILDSYQENKVVFPNIMNFTFLFDDTTSTPDINRKWSLNRYLGFYLEDMELTQTISPYITPFLRDDVIISDGNIIYSPTNTDPFYNEESGTGWVSTRPFYVECNGSYYKVERFVENVGVSLQKSKKTKGVRFIKESYQPTEVTRYRIISDVDLTGKQNDLNKNFGLIDVDNKLIDYNIDYLQIDGFEDADVWMIEIDGILHNLIGDGESIKIVTDYSFNFNQNDYEYTVRNETTKVSIIVDYNNQPKKFNIYKCKFSDIKDFDDRIIDTEYSKYEYEKEDEITLTDETKMYMENLSSRSNPKDLDDFIYKDEVVNIPVSSEYTANYETFKIDDDDLSEIWRKNPVYCRWSYQNSTSANDYPYSLNNSNMFEEFNRSVNPFDPDPKRIERNLDYFYTINSSTASYLHHTLHIESFDDNGDIDTNFRFELDKYLNVATYSTGSASSATYSFDYFTSLFDRNTYFNNSDIKKNVKKYSEFNIGDKSIPNTTLLRGIEFSIYDVESVTLNDSDELESFNISSSNRFDGYKFSILLSDNNFSIDVDNNNVTVSDNLMDWTIIDDWKMDKDYATGSVVIFDDILYVSNSNVTTNNPIRLYSLRQVKSAPYNQSQWEFYDQLSISYGAPIQFLGPNNIFWEPNTTYTTNDFVYNHGEYYKYSSGGTEDFWNPASSSTGYDFGDVVLYKGNYYMSMTSSNHYDPNFRRKFVRNNQFSTSGYWVGTQSSNPRWKTIELWNPSVSYLENVFPVGTQSVIHNDTIWSTSTPARPGNEPGVSNIWTQEYRLEPDTDYVYPGQEALPPLYPINPIIDMNNRYYLCNSNISDSTLDNGIVIYINKKWKNVLININISDNTLPNISETDRDELYDDLYKKVTAYNFMESINDISNKNGFTDYVNYVIIEEDGTFTRHNYKNNIETLPYMIKCNNPDLFSTKIKSLRKIPIELPNELNPKKELSNGKIKSLNDLNYFNKIPIASNIIENQFRPKVFENYHGNKNIVADNIYRFSGFYMPLFYDLQIFEKNSEYKTSGNYKFDTTLTDFGIIKERKIRKINRKGSVLKLSEEEDIKSIYPMVDEFGYGVKDFFIFASTWDYKYHVETLNLRKRTRPNIRITTPLIIPKIIGQPLIIKKLS